MKAEHLRSRVLGAKAFRGDFCPNATRGPIFRDFFQKVVVRIQEEREARAKRVNIESSIYCSLDVGGGVAKREGEFLDGNRSSLPYVVDADGDRITVRNVSLAMGENVGNEPQRKLWRIDIGSAGNIFLEDIVLNCAVYLLRRNTLLLCDGNI